MVLVQDTAQTLNPFVQVVMILVAGGTAGFGGGAIGIRWVLNGMREDVQHIRDMLKSVACKGDLEKVRDIVGEVRERVARLEATLR